MTDRPILILANPTVAKKARLRGFGGKRNVPTVRRQVERIGPRIEELEAALERRAISAQTSPEGLSPEDVLVLETAGTEENFFRAVEKIPGLEFLGEFNEFEVEPDDDFFGISQKGDPKSYTGRVYLVFTNQEALRQIRRLWTTYVNGDEFLRGTTKWRNVFALLRDIRPWGTKDRLEETGVLEDWRGRVAFAEQGFEREPAPCEIELWHREDARLRRLASGRVRQQVAGLQGQVLKEVVIPEIRYHAMSVLLPITAVEAILDESRREGISLLKCEQIQFIRASGQTRERKSVSPSLAVRDFRDKPLPRGRRPTVGLLDGLPLQNHSALAERLIIDDPDDFARDYPPEARVHGTGMASLIVWGDLNKPDIGPPIKSPVYVRSIMRPGRDFDGRYYEEIPRGELLVDLIHRSVLRIRGPNASPDTQDVSVVNLSIGDFFRPFDKELSPLAKLLDWLSWHYRILFLVSAGNWNDDVPIGEEGDPASLRAKVVEYLCRDTRNRRLLSPAESMNSVTVGACHDDYDSRNTGHMAEVAPVNRGDAGVYSRHGLGYARTVKPDIIAPGGRTMLRRDAVREVYEQSSHPSMLGQRVAAPGSRPGELASTTNTQGTSNATALMTRASALFIDVLTSLKQGDNGSVVENVPDAVWVKAMLVHCARWGDEAERLRATLFQASEHRSIVQMITRTLGYGATDPSVVQECAKNRATALAGATLKKGEGMIHKFPLPPSLSGKRGLRRLVVTLAWFTPVNPKSQRWRQASLWFETPQSRLEVGSNKNIRRVLSDHQIVRRGTVQHEVFEGEEAVALIDGDEIAIHVSCREYASGLKDQEVPYALVITFEVAPEISIDVYSEVRERVRARNMIRSRVGVRT